jgi:aminopeptidase N
MRSATAAAYVSTLLFVAVSFLCNLPTVAAASAIPNHRITASFDLGKHQIKGTVEITLPQDVNSILVGKDLRLQSLVLNGKPFVPSVASGSVALPPHPDHTILLIDYEGVFQEGASPDLANIIGREGAYLTGDWYPAAVSPLGLFSLRVYVPKGFHAVSEADTITAAESGQRHLVAFDFPHPVPGIHLVVAPYVVTRERLHSIELVTYFLPEDQGFAEQYLVYARRYLQMYEEMLGPYPFHRFAVVENILPTGYGMPTFTLLGRQVLKLPFIPETSLGHEILHSWFGNSVYVDYRGGNWSEGLTSYLADQHYAVLRGEGAQYRKNILEEYESYVQRSNEIEVRDFVSGEDRAVRAVGYGKTAMIFHMLKGRIGAPAFHAGLKRLVEERRFKITSWADLERIFSEVAGQDLRDFFGFWLDRKGAIEIMAGQLKVRESGKTYRLELPLRLEGAPFPVEIPISVVTSTGSEMRAVKMTTSEQTLTLSVNAPPEKVVIDPDYDLFRMLAPAERRPLWSRLLGDPTRTLVLPERNGDKYSPLAAELGRRGFRTVPVSEVTRARLQEGAYLFLDSAPDWISVFAKRKTAAPGFSLEIKGNPLNPHHVIGLVEAADREEVQAVGSRLFHYGQQSRLEFSQGRNLVKEAGPGEVGIQIDVPPQATGIPGKASMPLSAIVNAVADKTIVYVGERHDRYGDHIAQLEVIQGVHERHRDLAIGMEMFQSRYQKALDDYIAGTVDEETFLQKAHYFTSWGFNYFLYRDILLYARNEKIPVIGLNIPKELVGKVARHGLAHLSQEEQALLPKEMEGVDEGYRERLQRAFAMHRMEMPGGEFPISLESFIEAQVLWDESMAAAIAAYLGHHPGSRMVILAGNGHLEFGSGIPKRAYRLTGKSYVTVLPYSGGRLEEGFADYILFPPSAQAPEAPKLLAAIEPSAEGPVVRRFFPGSGAEEAGIKEGDVIVGIDERKVSDLDDLQAFLMFRRAGEKVLVAVIRGGERLEFPVELKTGFRMHETP